MGARNNNKVNSKVMKKSYILHPETLLLLTPTQTTKTDQQVLKVKIKMQLK